jgi:hypothetical protein
MPRVPPRVLPVATVPLADHPFLPSSADATLCATCGKTTAAHPSSGTPPEMATTTPANAAPTLNLPPGATSEPAVPIAEKIIGAGIALVPNGASVSNIDPWLAGFSGILCILLDKLKQEKWFPEGWTPYVMVLAALAIGWGVYHLLAAQDAAASLGKGSWIATQSHANWIGGKRLGLLTPTAPENRRQAPPMPAMKPALLTLMLCGF